MNVEIEDLHRVVGRRREHGRRVVLGGHSLGGSITTAYATWDFNGKPGAKDLAGLVYIDGGSDADSGHAAGRDPVAAGPAERLALVGVRRLKRSGSA